MAVMAPVVALAEPAALVEAAAVAALADRERLERLA
jgi:hypothetical protein